MALPRPRRLGAPARLTTLLSVILTAGSLSLAVPVASAAPAATGSAPRSASPARTDHKILAKGLDNPRLLSFGTDGALYVAEAGTGGSGPCVTGGEGTVCLGRTGAITRIHHGHRHRVLRKLPSLAGTGGAQASGPTDVLVSGKRFAITVGGGVDLPARKQLGRAGKRIGTVVTGRLGHRGHVTADLVRFEARKNPDHSVGRDSNPTGMVATRRGWLLTDSGGNTLLRVRAASGKVRTVAVFPTRTATLPPPMGGGTVPMQAVPTAVALGPDGAYYVSQLTGFPFPAGEAKIFRVVPGKAPKVWAGGLTNVTDLAWHKGRLYAVQLAESGLLSVPEGTLPTGSLVRVRPGAKAHPRTVARLTAPYGVAIRGHRAYVTTCSVCPGGGTVTRVPLHPAS